MFSQAQNISQTCGLYSALFFCQQGDKLLSEHFGILENLWEELNAHHPLTNDIEIRRKHKEKFKVARFLSSLNHMYENLRNSILTEKELLSVRDVYTRL